jgi:hypothetical protein
LRAPCLVLEVEQCCAEWNSHHMGGGVGPVMVQINPDDDLAEG